MLTLNPPKVIALTGKAGSGKDTVRHILRDHFQYAGYAFADPLREMIQGLLLDAGVSLKYMRERELKEAVIPELGVSYRRMIQTLGTEWGRNCLHENFWVDVLKAKIMSDFSDTFDNFRVVISDLRVHTEALMVRDLGGVIWRINRESAGIGDAHQSESEMDELALDISIDNNGTIEDLTKSVQDLMRSQYGTQQTV